MSNIQKGNKLRTLVGASIFAAGFVSASAFAAVTIDDDGFGFVGKGDIQLAFDWNNKEFQACMDNRCLEFVGDMIKTETTWNCYNSKNGKTQGREATTESVKVATAVARVRNQVTGINLEGWGDSEGTVTTSGNKLLSCPDENGNWSLVADSEESTTTGGTTGALRVRAYGGDLVELPVTQ